MREVLDHLQGDQPLGQQPQRPALATLGWGAAGQRDQAGLLLPIQLAAVLTIRAWVRARAGAVPCPIRVWSRARSSSDKTTTCCLRMLGSSSGGSSTAKSMDRTPASCKSRLTSY